jgi:hypothetical protein
MMLSTVSANLPAGWAWAKNSVARPSGKMSFRAKKNDISIGR